MLQNQNQEKTLMTSLTHAISRRDFMKNAAVAAALPILLARAGHGEEKKPAHERLTMGFIGIGTQMRGHLAYFLGQKDVQVLAVCEVDTTRRDHAKKMVEERYGKDIKSGIYKGCDAYVDFHEI